MDNKGKEIVMTYIPSLDELYTLVKKGDKDAFDLIYDKTWDLLYAIAYSRLKDEDAVKDILQEIYLDIWIKREVRCIDNLMGYLTNCVKKKVIDYFRKNIHTVEVVDDFAEIIVGSEYADTRLHDTELARVFAAWYDNLPRKRKEIFRFRYEDDYSTREISDLLKISRKTVQNQLLNSKGEFQNMLKKIFTIFLGL